MKPPNLFIKTTVLLFFTGLIICFVAYRSGAFDKWLSKSNPTVVKPGDDASLVYSENTLDRTVIDSPPPSANATVKKDSFAVKPVMMSGSKSGLVVYPGNLQFLPPDSTPEKRKLPDSLSSKSRKKKLRMMSGSKSGPIILPASDTTEKK